MIDIKNPTALPDGVELLTITQVTDRLKVSRSTFYNMVKAGLFPIRKVFHSTRVRSDDLDRFIDGLAAVNQAAEVR